MSIPDIAVAISTAILYPLFFRKLADVVSNRQEIEKLCGGNKHVRFDLIGLEEKPKKSNLAKDKCLKDKEEKEKKMEMTRFGILLMAGLMALALSYYVTNTSMVLGFGLGGVLAICAASCEYWHYMDDKAKLLLVGIALVALLLSPQFVVKYTTVLTNI